MSGDWAAVAKAINQRLAELGLSQRELIERSQVSKAVVGEIQHNTVQRRRSSRTLVALSLALDLHPDHLTAVLEGRRPPLAGEPAPRSHDDVPGRLSVIEHQLREITDRLDKMGTISAQLEEINANVATVIERMDPKRK